MFSFAFPLLLLLILYILKPPQCSVLEPLLFLFQIFIIDLPTLPMVSGSLVCESQTSEPKVYVSKCLLNIAKVMFYRLLKFSRPKIELQIISLLPKTISVLYSLSSVKGPITYSVTDARNMSIILIISPQFN